MMIVAGICSGLGALLLVIFTIAEEGSLAHIIRSWLLIGGVLFMIVGVRLMEIAMKAWLL